MGKTVWINLEETQVDTSTLKKRLTDAGFDVRYRTVSADDTAGIIEQGRRADAVVSTAERWNEATLPQVSGSLKLIMRYGAGIDNVDLSAATDAGICVANVPELTLPQWLKWHCSTF